VKQNYLGELIPSEAEGSQGYYCLRRTRNLGFVTLISKKHVYTSVDYRIFLYRIHAK